jgi:redox-sensing transcriptional repressor
LGRGLCSDPGVTQHERDRTGGDQVSELTTARLSVYLRCLEALDTRGVNTVSSQELATQFQLNAAQIRKDLAHFGEFGIRGVGYYVKDLKRHLRQILGLDRSIKVIIVGAGNLGLALADYAGFRQDGFDVVALLDTARDKVGQYSRSGVPIRHARDLERLVERERIDIAVLCVPADAAQESVDAVVAAGVRAILNFSPGSLRVPSHVKLKSMDLTITFESLSFFLANGHIEP